MWHNIVLKCRLQLIIYSLLLFFTIRYLIQNWKFFLIHQYYWWGHLPTRDPASLTKAKKSDVSRWTHSGRAHHVVARFTDHNGSNPWETQTLCNHFNILVSSKVITKKKKKTAITSVYIWIKNSDLKVNNKIYRK